MQVTVQESPIVAATGYSTTISYFATQYKQGGRITYGLHLTPTEITTLIAKPDPSAHNPGNRAIRPLHAAAFAKYLRDNTNWVIPSLIFRVASTFKFTPITLEGVTIDGTAFGTVEFPRRVDSEIHILDGQHRVLGFFQAAETLAKDVDAAQSALARARRLDPEGAGVREAKQLLKEYEKQATRLSVERVSVEIAVEPDMPAYRQMFFDIADNAIGISGSVKTRFDGRKVVNRALTYLLEHPLLVGRVDLEKDRISGSSNMFIGARHVAELNRCVMVGLNGRISRRQNAEWTEKEVAQAGLDFLDVLVESFPQLEALSVGQVSPVVLRQTSHLSSVSFLRVLAAAFFELKDRHAYDRDMIVAGFRKLAPFMAGPTYEGSVWTENLPSNVIGVDAMGPSSRRQDLPVLERFIIDSILSDAAWLNEAPPARPAKKDTEAEAVAAEQLEMPAQDPFLEKVNKRRKPAAK